MIRRKVIEKSERGWFIFRVSDRIAIRRKGRKVENIERDKGVSDIVRSAIQHGK